MLGHELTHIRNGDVRMLVIAVIIAGVIGFFAELVFRMFFQSGVRWSSGRSSGGSSDRGKGGGGAAIIIAIALIAVGVAALDRDPLRAVAAARISGRRRRGRAHQEPRRHDHGAAQDRGPRRARRRAPPRSWRCASTIRARASPTCSRRIRSIESRIKALIEFAGGHDPGPLDLPEPGDETGELQQQEPQGSRSMPATPPPKPFLPSEPPVVLGGGAPAAQPEVTGPASRPLGPRTRPVIDGSELETRRISPAPNTNRPRDLPPCPPSLP